MTKVLSVSEIKRGKVHSECDGKPKHGTKLREAYDRLRRGETVPLLRYGERACTQLRDRYGMEIVSDYRGSRLIGEWHGSEYVPVERIVVSLSEDA
jgi:hypothetical protein